MVPKSLNGSFRSNNTRTPEVTTLGQPTDRSKDPRRSQGRCLSGQAERDNRRCSILAVAFARLPPLPESAFLPHQRRGSSVK